MRGSPKPALAAKSFALACQYRNAADLLCDVLTAGTNTLPILLPTYFLYHHAIELVLTAFLLARIGKARSANHDIEALYQLCQDEGLIVKQNHEGEAQTFISFLAGGNRNHFYRYPVENRGKGGGPMLAWMREDVAPLFEAIAPVAENKALLPSKGKLYLGKPIITKQPAPLKPGP